MIESNGLKGHITHGGGGSGGSILLKTMQWAGSGKINANGGDGSQYGGAGSGGRIAIHYERSTFSGTYSSHGGSGSHPGGPGTIFIRNSLVNESKLTVDNNVIPSDSPPFSSVYDSNGRVAWITEIGTNVFDFNVVELINNGALAIQPIGDQLTVPLLLIVI